MEDPFEFNKGAKRGALVEARIGKGRWIYVGLSLSRQLEAGVPGAYRLLENLLQPAELEGAPGSQAAPRGARTACLGLGVLRSASEHAPALAFYRGAGFPPDVTASQPRASARHGLSSTRNRGSERPRCVPRPLRPRSRSHPTRLVGVLSQAEDSV